MTLLDDVKQRLDIVDVVSRHVQLQQSGKTFKARCPFHNERTPSFIVFPESQTWRCFGACAIGGDAIGFVMRQEGLPFGEALRRLARDLGVAVPSPAAPTRANPLYQVNREAVSFYQKHLLEATEAEDVRRYVAKRGITGDSIAAFQLGLAPNEFAGLTHHLSGLSFPPELQVEAGLALRSDDGRIRDRFRGRLMFPIWDAQGQVVGFSGRSLDGSEPKYMNSPKTPLFDKGSLLYGWHRAQDAIRAGGEAVVVEGYTDVIVLHQEGFQNVVASMGTSLTQQQVGLLESLASTCVLALDPDAAGQEATFRSLETSWRVFQRPEGGRVRGGTVIHDRRKTIVLKIAGLPDGKDPDEIALQAKDAWRTVIQEAKSLPDFLFDTLPPRYDLATAEGRRQVAERLGAVVVALSAQEQGRYLTRLEQLVGVDRRTLDEVLGISRRALLRQAGAQVRGTPSAGAAPFRQVLGDPLERNILRLLFQHPNLEQHAEALLPDHFQGAENRELFTAWKAWGTLEMLQENLDPVLLQHLRELLDANTVSGGSIPPRDELADCVRRLEERRLRQMKRRQESADVQDGNESGDGPVQDVLEVNRRLLELFKERGERSRT
ncbi:MAG: DNA primase [Dehalococcoidia bacterium]|nr:DNA primase [Dehalococcoidia bacterium]